MTTAASHRIQCPYVATDAIIMYKNGAKKGIVIIERKNMPYGLALPGGFAEYGLTFEQNVMKEVKEETNLDFIIESPEHPLCVHSDPGRDPRSHIASLFYVGKGVGTLQAGDDAKGACVVSIDELVTMLGKKMFVFTSHERAISEYLAREGYAAQDRYAIGGGA